MPYSFRGPEPSIDPGEFRNRAVFLDQVLGTDAAGASESWQAPDNAPLWMCKSEEVRGIEMLRAGQDVSQVFVMLTGWNRANVVASKKVRMVASGAELIVQAVQRIGNSEIPTYMTLTCLALGANS